jgi:hypothetical protein
MEDSYVFALVCFALCVLVFVIGLNYKPPCGNAAVLEEIKWFILYSKAHPYRIEIQMTGEYCRTQTRRYINKNAYI